MTRTPIESFLDLTRKSGLVDPTRLGLYLDRLEAAQPIPEDPKEMANVLVRDAVLSRFQADQLLSGKWRGFYVGKYRVIERIGIGGMGQVYLAEHRTMKRRYAIKVLPRAKASDPAALERFEREARAGGSIDHPNIVRAYDKDQDGDLHYLVMDFVDGCSLSEIVHASGPLDPQRAGHYMYQSALGLQHAHDSGLIHRDIKPANILIDREGTVKILDMGLARFFNDHEDIITKKYDETVLGTADYLSPEQAIDSHSVDIRSDIYSLGCTFFYTLTGQPPFGDGSVAQKLIWHQTRTPRPVHELRAGVPAELEAILARCMMKKVQDRFGSPEELLEALQPYANFSYPPTEDELAELSPMARGVPFGGEILSGVTAASIPVILEPLSRDPDSRSPIFDSQVAQRGTDDSTVSIRSGDSSVKGLNKGTDSTAPVISAVAPAPTIPMMVTPAKAAGIAPRPQSSPPIVIGKDPPSPMVSARKNWDQYPSPVLDSKNAGDRVVTVMQAKEGPRKQKKKQADAIEQVQEEKQGWPLWVWLTLVIAGLAIFFAVALFLVLKNRSAAGAGPSSPATASNTAQKPAGPRTWYVARNKLDGIDHTTITQALQQAGPGDTIVITDRQTYQESLHLTPKTSSQGLINITLKAEVGDDGKRARLVPPPGHPPVKSLVTIDQVEGFKLSGFLLDGDDAVQTTLLVNGRCSGLQLDDVRLEGFQQHGIVVDNLTGSGRREVRFDRVHVKQNASQPASAAIRIQGASCDGLQLRHCRIQGAFQSAIWFGAPTQRFLMEQCRLFGGQGRAMLWSDTIGANPRMNAMIQQNTFWNFETGFALDVPVKTSDIYMTVRNNLFFQVKNLLQVDATKTKIKPEALSGGWVGSGNVFDNAGSKPGMGAMIPKFVVKGLDFTLNTSPTPPNDFLRYPANSPLATAGERKDAVGATE
ncbi:MAG: serine/threonine protein kinase [Planctomycetia bacterium]|nr:serine/threonine protein kinase [Planctomycetia bacterium]